MNTLSLTKEARIYNGEKTVSLMSGAGKIEQLHVKNETRTLSNTMHKRYSVLFMVQLPRLCMTTGKSIALTIHMAKIFSSKDQASFNFMTSVTIHSEFGAQENKVCYCFHRFPHLFAMK